MAVHIETRIFFDQISQLLRVSLFNRSLHHHKTCKKKMNFEKLKNENENENEKRKKKKEKRKKNYQ